MIIRRKSSISGIVRTKDIECNPKDYEMWEKGYLNMQDALGYLKQEDRDFILGGITSEEWENMWKEEICNIVMDHV
jgi:hypothetical protein